VANDRLRSGVRADSVRVCSSVPESDRPLEGSAVSGESAKSGVSSRGVWSRLLCGERDPPVDAEELPDRSTDQSSVSSPADSVVVAPSSVSSVDVSALSFQSSSSVSAD
jgi:hypothetical protein